MGSEATGTLVDTEVRSMINIAMARTLELLREKKDLIEQLAELLLEKEVLEREDMVAVLGPRPWARRQVMMILLLELAVLKKTTHCLLVFKHGIAKYQKIRN